MITYETPSVTWADLTTKKDFSIFTNVNRNPSAEQFELCCAKPYPGHFPENFAPDRSLVPLQSSHLPKGTLATLLTLTVENNLSSAPERESYLLKSHQQWKSKFENN